MRNLMLALLFFSTTCLSCQQQAENAHLAETRMALGGLAPKPLHAAYIPKVASNIIFQSKDGGDTWQDVSAGLPENLPAGRVLVDGGKLYLAAEQNLYFSELNHSAPLWEGNLRLGINITNLFSGQHGPYLNSYYTGFFKTLLGTEMLIPLHNALEDKTVRVGLETADGVLFIGCENGLFKSADSGSSWKQLLTGTGINSLTMANGVLICGTHEGLSRSTDGGEHWEKVHVGEGPAFGTGYAQGRFYAISQGSKKWNEGVQNQMYFSTDDGKTWQRMDESLASAQLLFLKETSLKPAQHIFDLKHAGNYLFCSSDAGIFRSADWGKSWEPVFPNSDKKFIQLAVSGDVVYAVQVVGC